MKIKFALIAALFVAAATNASAQYSNQSTATATASATIVKPIVLTKQTDLNFGNVAAGTGGTVVLAPGASAVRTAVGTFLPATTGVVSAAKFEVTGESNLEYTIKVPSSVTLTSGSNSMIVDQFTTDKTEVTANSTYKSTLANGSDNFYLGGRLNVDANQAAGQYVSAPFDVEVYYN